MKLWIITIITEMQKKTGRKKLRNTTIQKYRNIEIQKCRNAVTQHLDPVSLLKLHEDTLAHHAVLVVVNVVLVIESGHLGRKREQLTANM